MIKQLDSDFLGCPACLLHDGNLGSQKVAYQGRDKCQPPENPNTTSQCDEWRSWHSCKKRDCCGRRICIGSNLSRCRARRTADYNQCLARVAMKNQQATLNTAETELALAKASAGGGGANQTVVYAGLALLTVTVGFMAFKGK